MAPYPVSAEGRPLSASQRDPGEMRQFGSQLAPKSPWETRFDVCEAYARAMGRNPRIQFAGALYHVTTRGQREGESVTGRLGFRLARRADRRGRYAIQLGLPKLLRARKPFPCLGRYARAELGEGN